MGTTWGLNYKYLKRLEKKFRAISFSEIQWFSSKNVCGLQNWKVRRKTIEFGAYNSNRTSNKYTTALQESKSNISETAMNKLIKESTLLLKFKLIIEWIISHILKQIEADQTTLNGFNSPQ